MYYFYEDNEVRNVQRAPIPYDKINATGHWVRHYQNSKYLTFFAQHEVGFHERNQATKELGIAESKMRYWTRHPNFDLAEAGRKAKEVDKLWNTEPGQK